LPCVILSVFFQQGKHNILSAIANKLFIVCFYFCWYYTVYIVYLVRPWLRHNARYIEKCFKLFIW